MHWRCFFGFHDLHFVAVDPEVRMSNRRVGTLICSRCGGHVGHVARRF